MERPRAGEWLRDEINGWRDVGVENVVSLLEASEVRELELANEASYCEAAGIEFISFPMPDTASLRQAGAIIPSAIATFSSSHRVSADTRTRLDSA
jgi:hypothetical protein